MPDNIGAFCIEYIHVFCIMGHPQSLFHHIYMLRVVRAWPLRLGWFLLQMVAEPSIFGSCGTYCNYLVGQYYL